MTLQDYDDYAEASALHDEVTTHQLADEEWLRIHWEGKKP